MPLRVSLRALCPIAWDGDKDVVAGYFRDVPLGGIPGGGWRTWDAGGGE